MNNLGYSDLQIQKYLKCEQMSTAEAIAVYSYRTRMAIYSDDYKFQGDVTTCPLCHLHLDVQNLSFQCKEVKKNIQIGGK